MDWAYSSILLVTLFVGGVSLWANTRRMLNKLFALLALTQSVWLFCVIEAVEEGKNYRSIGLGNPAPWIVAAAVAASFMPLCGWLIKNAIETIDQRSIVFKIKCSFWLTITGFLIALCYSKNFIPFDSAPSHETHGLAYYLNFIVINLLFCSILIRSLFSWRKATGIKRAELGFLALNGSIGATVMTLLVMVSAFSQNRLYSRLNPVVLFTIYCVAAWGITNNKVFNARQLFFLAVQRLALLLAIIGSAYVIYSKSKRSNTTLLTFTAITSVASIVGYSAHAHFTSSTSRRIKNRTDQQKKELLSIFYKEKNPKSLITEFEHQLAKWTNAERVLILKLEEEYYVSSNLILPLQLLDGTSLCALGWTTPEALGRARSSPSDHNLQQIILKHDISGIVAPTRVSNPPNLIITIKRAENLRPITYPEIRELTELSEIIENLLSRAQSDLQAVQTAQLITIGLLGASFAHEIRNPLDSIRSFANLLIENKPTDQILIGEFAALIPKEVSRITHLTEQLLELARPKQFEFGQLDFDKIVSECLELLRSKLKRTTIRLDVDLNLEGLKVYRSEERRVG